MKTSTLVGTGLATAATAAAGSIATDPNSAWYRSLDKPAWQPPPVAFPVVWTPLYASIAFAAARALDATSSAAQRRGLRRAYAIDLVLNAGWTALFFRAHRPRLALAELVLLNAANAALLRRAWRADRVAGATLLPYLAWTGFATALNTAIALRNPGR
ncbi:tryptophan-rich sensory protein [Micromonospora sp. WMMD1102]|uniref:TspO/MBR family protein n=1 Tax=Micromonospora sp. WMMD1102 TaxID=3016105 RepID=UPI002415812F|nr:TspO/MBR family protein [Micromonospora sp. WMMD1102]MDG4789476.1 tryptophan-rich sensory protein [Micromonospora sp. WMMD1102]